MFKHGKTAIPESSTLILENLEDLGIEGQIRPRELPKFHFAEAFAFAQSPQIPCRYWLGQLRFKLFCRMCRRYRFFAVFSY